MLLLIVVVALGLTPMFVIVARRNPYTRQVVSDGWIPVVSAVCISNFAGWIYSLAGDMPGTYTVHISYTSVVTRSFIRYLMRPSHFAVLFAPPQFLHTFALAVLGC